MICPYLKEEGRICTAEVPAKGNGRVPTAIELSEFCTSGKYSLCYLFFANKDAKSGRS